MKGELQWFILRRTKGCHYSVSSSIYPISFLSLILFDDHIVSRRLYSMLDRRLRDLGLFHVVPGGKQTRVGLFFDAAGPQLFAFAAPRAT